MSNTCYNFDGRLYNTVLSANVFSREKQLSSLLPSSCCCGNLEPLIVNGNTGFATVTNNQISLLGRGGIQNTQIAIDTLDNCDYRNITPFIVGIDGPNLASQDPSEYSSIQLAINDALIAGATNQNKQIVFIKPGNYTENLTLNAAIVLHGTELGTVRIIGSHTYNSDTNDTLLVNNILFNQLPAGPLFNITSTMTSNQNLVLFKCFVLQDLTNPSVAISVICNGTAAVSLNCIECSITGVGNSVATVPTVQSTGPGSFNFTLISSNTNRCLFDIQSTAVGGQPLYATNNVRFNSSFLNNTQFLCPLVANNTTAYINGCRIDNDVASVAVGQLYPFLNVNSGIWQLTANQIDEALLSMFDMSELWLMCNFIFLRTFFAITDVPILLNTLSTRGYIENNLFSIDNGNLNWIDGSGTYFQSNAGTGSNTFRNGTGTGFSGTIVLAAAITA